MNWEHLFWRVGQAFYTEFLGELTAILVVLYYLIRKKKNSSHVYLIIIAIASLLQGLSIEYNDLAPGKSVFGIYVSQGSLYLYLIIEITCCLCFIKNQIESVIIKKIIWAGNIIFVAYTLLYWVYKPFSKHYFLQLPAIEGFLIFISCLYFFYELLNKGPNQKTMT